MGTSMLFIHEQQFNPKLNDKYVHCKSVILKSNLL